MNSYPASCHCGANVFTLHSEKAPEDFIPRCDARTCSFCAKNDGVWIADPEGRLEIEQQKTNIYRFASEVVDFHFCSTCGTLCYAIFEKDFAVARLACFPEILEVCRSTVETNFSTETIEEGKVRRRKNWTPLA